MASVAAFLLADGRLPAGGHAHSGGLEPIVEAGLVADVDDLERFLKGRLATAGCVAAALAAAACAGNGSWVRLQAEADARTVSSAQRLAARAQGRQLIRAARALWGVRGPDERQIGVRGPVGQTQAEVMEATGAQSESEQTGPFRGVESRADPDKEITRRSLSPFKRLTELEEAIPTGPHHAVAIGATAAAAGLEPLDAARLAAYGSVAGPASAAVRLLGLDPFAVHAVLACLAPAVEAVAAEAASAGLGSLEDLPCPSAPMLDIAAERHLGMEVRLFAS